MAAATALDAAHEALDGKAWREAYDLLTVADRERPLAPDDLDALGMVAHLAGEPEASASAWDRAHSGHVAAGETASAVRSAFWLGLTLLLAGEHARGGGWLGRAQRELELAELDCAERGYLQVPRALQALRGGDLEGAHDVLLDIARTAERFDDADLRALGQLGQGQVLAARGDAARGVSLLDEAMVGVTADEVSPIVTGVVYCAVIITCREALDIPRAQEWTAALGRWCESQPSLKPFRGQCLVHRSELMQLHGEWTDAVAEAQLACEHLSEPAGDPVLGMAMYQRAELLRLRGSYSLAEVAYREADSCGHRVQPGLALLRLAQDRPTEASSGIRQAVSEAQGARDRLHTLSACVEIMLATGDVPSARSAVADLEDVTTGLDSGYLRAAIAHARGTVLVAEGDLAAGVLELRRARTEWQALAAPYEIARTRVRLAEAYRKLGDHGTAAMELDAACRTFDGLGAMPALSRARTLLGEGGQRADVPGGLSPRELEVLTLVAKGWSNRRVAERLVISDRTVARHVSNIFAKLGVSSRSAATAYAYEHGLVQ